MNSARLNELSAREIARGIAARKFTSEAVIRDCLARIEEREPTIKAWAALDPEIALRQARDCDKRPAKGPLHGVPVGIKDVIDTADFPTEMGSPIYRNNRPGTDAASVALLRAAGAVILGKTVTCEFAGATPAETVNPLDPERTPGGSSSGSAAAIADHMVPLALGTQTRGSILRPASYCGIVGYKPSYGLVAREGLKFAAETFDTIGVLAGNIDDAELCFSGLIGRARAAEREFPSPRIGIIRDGLEHAAPETVTALEDAAARLVSAGANLHIVAFPCDLETFTIATQTVNDVERSRALAWEWQNSADLISEKMRAVVERGFIVPTTDYIAALRLIETCRIEIERIFDGVDVILAPCAKGEAPRGLEHTGDPFFQSFWTALHLPALSLPTHSGPSGLPVAIQLVGRKYDDDSLLAAARRIFALVRGG